MFLCLILKLELQLCCCGGGCWLFSAYLFLAVWVESSSSCQQAGTEVAICFGFSLGYLIDSLTLTFPLVPCWFPQFFLSCFSWDRVFLLLLYFFSVAQSYWGHLYSAILTQLLLFSSLTFCVKLWVLWIYFISKSYVEFITAVYLVEWIPGVIYNNLVKSNCY